MSHLKPLILGSACLPGMLAAAGPVGERFTKEQHAIVHATPDRIFPLLCPVREYDWLPDWRCEMIYSKSGVVEQDCVFITCFKDEGPSVWVTTLHDSATHRVSFVRVISGKRVVKLEIQVQEAEAGTSRLLWRNSYMGLSKEANEELTREAASGWKGQERNFRRILESLERYLAKDMQS